MVQTRCWLFPGVMAVKSDTNVGKCCCISSHILLHENVLIASGVPLRIDSCWSEHILLNSLFMIQLNDFMIFPLCNFTIVLLKAV